MRGGGNPETSGSPTLTRVEVVFLFYAGGAPGQAARLASRTFPDSVAIPLSGDETGSQSEGGLCVSSGKCLSLFDFHFFRLLEPKVPAKPF